MERDLHDAVKCSTCGSLLYDEDFEKITWQKKTYCVCPYCLSELIDSHFVGLTDEDIREIKIDRLLDD